MMFLEYDLKVKKKQRRIEKYIANSYNAKPIENKFTDRLTSLSFFFPLMYKSAGL